VLRFCILLFCLLVYLSFFGVLATAGGSSGQNGRERCSASGATGIEAAVCDEHPCARRSRHWNRPS
jgi:hypothetical protein